MGKIGLIARLGNVTGADRVRRNHALEHAAITVASERSPLIQLQGRSNTRGFYIFGDISTADLRSAIDEAQRRLNAGEAELAIHPRCGTNLAVAAVLTGLAAAGAAQLKPRQNRFGYAILASMASLLVAPGLGTEAQRHVTTLADLGDLHVESVERRSIFWRPAHWVRTRST